MHDGLLSFHQFFGHVPQRHALSCPGRPIIIGLFLEHSLLVEVSKILGLYPRWNPALHIQIDLSFAVYCRNFGHHIISHEASLFATIIGIRARSESFFPVLIPVHIDILTRQRLAIVTTRWHDDPLVLVTLSDAGCFLLPHQPAYILFDGEQLRFEAADYLVLVFADFDVFSELEGDGILRRLVVGALGRLRHLCEVELIFLLGSESLYFLQKIVWLEGEVHFLEVGFDGEESISPSRGEWKLIFKNKCKIIVLGEHWFNQILASTQGYHWILLCQPLDPAFPLKHPMGMWYLGIHPILS